MTISFQKLFFAISTVFVLFAILIFAKTILIPIGTGLMIAFILYPLVKKLETWGLNKIIATFLALLSVVVLLAGGAFLFSTQIVDLTQELGSFRDKIIFSFTDLSVYLNENFGFVPNLEKNELFERLKEWLKDSKSTLVKQTFNNTASFLYGLLATFMYSFLFLIYRGGLVKAFSSFAPEKNRDRLINMYKGVQQVGQKYLVGMVILILVIGLANSIGLLIIGIENPFLFGFLGAILSIIPYIGTVSGAVLPALFAFISYDSLGMVLAVILLFWAVQLITDYFLSPKIVGESMNINAFAAILSLIIGAAVWGIAGMILFLPFAAMLKIVCDEYEELRPIALLISNKNYNNKGKENHFMSRGLHKLSSWFKRD